MSMPHLPRRAARVALVGLGLALTVGASSAAAAGPTGDYAVQKYCPLDNPSVTSCLYQETTGGAFQLGNATVPINKKIILRGGYYQDPASPTGFRFVNAKGVDTLTKVPLDVPGGLTGLVVPSEINKVPLLGPLFTAAVNSVNGVKATAELVGPVGFSFLSFLTGAGPTVELPVRIKLDNPFLGDSCYIGNASTPVRLRLTTGTTAPPPPNAPVSGTPGLFEPLNGGDLLRISGYTLVDNAFAAPKAENCGPTGLKWAVTPIVNLKEGLPSAAGKNSATLKGDRLEAASAEAVRASTR
jgi:hypothetical protein